MSHIVVVVCHGCCCGTARKHPDVDHDAHLRRLEQAIQRCGQGTVRVSECLNQCSESNLIQVRRSRSEHGRSRREVLWFGRVLDDDQVGDLAAWVELGCEGDPPEALVPHLFGPSALRYRSDLVVGSDPTVGSSAQEREGRVENG